MLTLRLQARFGGQRPQARLLGRRSSRTPSGTANALGGINPAPTNLPKCPAKPDGRNHPGDRRAGCPHPAAPRGGTNVSILNRQCAAGVNARPTEPGKCRGQPGNRAPAAPQTPVGDDACIVPRTLRRRKAPGGMPSSRRTPRRRKRLNFKSPMCGGRERPPYRTGKMRRPTGKLRPRITTNLCRGRCSHRPGNPAAA